MILELSMFVFFGSLLVVIIFLGFVVIRFVGFSIRG